MRGLKRSMRGASGRSLRKPRGGSGGQIRMRRSRSLVPAGMVAGQLRLAERGQPVQRVGAVNGRLAGQQIAIVGLGGTGSYILDLVAKCPVGEIHLYDGDRFSSHTAFRAPGAASLEEVRRGDLKVERYKELYSKQKRKITAHGYDINAANVSELAEVAFVFLAMEGGATKRAIVEGLERMDKPFVNASLGVKQTRAGDQLQAIVEVNGSTPGNRTSLRDKVDFGELDEDDPYIANIQVAELNALNAAMAVLWWKKWAGIYVSSKQLFWMLVDTYLDGLYTDRA